MTKRCDNQSVGVLIKDDSNRMLLIERKKFPFGYAPPAGHIDDFASPEDCAIGEVQEEVGLKVESLELVYQGRHENRCRREGGYYHNWHVFKASVSGEITASPDEVSSYKWCSQSEFEKLIIQTREYITGKISEEDWQREPGLEPVWLEIFESGRNGLDY